MSTPELKALDIFEEMDLLVEVPEIHLKGYRHSTHFSAYFDSPMTAEALTTVAGVAMAHGFSLLEEVSEGFISFVAPKPPEEQPELAVV